MIRPNSNTRTLGILPLAIAVAFVLLAGCTFNVPIRPFENKPLIKKRNITAGIYYSQKFRDAVHVEKLSRINHNISVGKASVKMFDQVFASAFDQVVDIKEWPAPDTSLSEADVVIEPTLEAFWVIPPKPPQVPPLPGYHFEEQVYSVYIKYQIKFHSEDGMILGSHAVLAEGQRRYIFTWRHPLSDATERAIRDAAAKISVAINADEKIEGWLRTSEPIIYRGKQEQTSHIESHEKVPPALLGQPDDREGGQQ